MIEYLEHKKIRYPIRISYYVIHQFQRDTNSSIYSIEKNKEYLKILLKYSLICGSNFENNKVINVTDFLTHLIIKSDDQILDKIYRFFPADIDNEIIDISYMFSAAISRLNLNLNEFLEITPIELHTALNDKYNNYILQDKSNDISEMSNENWKIMEEKLKNL